LVSAQQVTATRRQDWRREFAGERASDQVDSLTLMKPTMDEAWVPFKVIVATTHRVEKYGGVALADSALMQIVDALNGGDLPMIGNHDWTRPIRTNDLDATLVTLEDGERAVRLTGLVHQGDLDAVGEIGGMSFTSFEPTGRADGPNRDPPSLKLSADAGWFDDETVGEACSIMSELAPVEGARLLQFSAVEDARVILEMGYPFVMALGTGLATNAVWEGIKHLLARRQKRDGDSQTSRTRIELVTPLLTGEVIAIVDTTDAAIVSQALATYATAVAAATESGSKGRHVVVWRPDGSSGSWLPPA
jgi:hypothetical protein